MGITHLLQHYTVAQTSYHSSFFSLSRVPDNYIHYANRLLSLTSCHVRGYRRDSDTEPSIGVGDDGGDGFGSRVWWSNDKGKRDYDEDEDELEGFGVLEDAIDMGLVFKVLKAIGWMIPAIFMWILVGNSNTFFMALAIPIVQSAVDLFTNENRRTKKRVKVSKKARMAKQRRGDAGSVRERSQTSKTANSSSKKTSQDVADRFRGWDELDNKNDDDSNKGVSYEDVGKHSMTVMRNQANEEGERRLSKRMTSREKPLLVRLLIAVFPFLGTWMRVM